ncbi:hypothetical protein K435DRAFT_869809 [Dendrothele bispora CBS 962.96]|uniref:Uncharacterized protein n=1 Tax=Dendrothele bispora (strain CBS 962.96) TaxID=1314807 RepID=A0A4S8L8Y3_DENBC|nr:hypothetical protein K435DRAFT_869809 [Dendrothele bispora CBS 962.96]
MLLRLTSSDMLNTSLVDVITGKTMYTIVTSIVDIQDTPESLPGAASPFGIISPSLVLTDRLETTSVHLPSSRPSSPSTRVSPTPEKLQLNDAPPTLSSIQVRKTEIQASDSGTLLADIRWNGRRPDIMLMNQHVGPLTALFDITTVQLLPNTLAIPSRFDTEFVWNATAHSLTLIDLDSDQTKGTFHQNVFRVSSSSNSAAGKFIHTRIPGVGHNYIEFESHPLVEDVEIIVSFFMMEILRRGRFALTPYMFERPKLWQIIEAKDLIMRRLSSRRNTV